MPANSAAMALTPPALPQQFVVGEWSVFADFSYIEHSSGRREELEWMAIEVLRYLAIRQSELVSVDELMDKVWTGKIVTEGTVRRIISLLRKAFGDDAKAPAYIQSIPKRGYVLIAKVSIISVSKPVIPGVAASSSPTHALPAIDTPTSLPQIPAGKVQHAHSAKRLIWLLLAVLALGGGYFWPKPAPQLDAVLTLKGPDRDPFLAPNSNELYFSHKNQPQDHWHLYRQDLQSQQTQQLTRGEQDEFMPQLSPQQDKLAFLQIEQQQIRLLVSEVRQDGSISRGTVIKQSNTGISDIEWNQSGSGLYISTANSDGTFAVWFQPLDGTTAKQLTLPPTNSIGDLQVATSADQKYLAVIRVQGKASVLNNSPSSLLVFKLDGMLPVLTRELPGRAHSVDFVGESLVYLIENRLYQTSLDGREESRLVHTQTHPISQMSSSGSSLLLSYGDLYNAEIRENSNPFVQNSDQVSGLVISSQTSDYFAEYSRIDNTVFFLSTRSRTRQIWQWEPKKGYRQLSQFEENLPLSSLSPAHQHDWLAGISGGRAFILDNSTKQLTYLDTADGHLVQVLWQNDDLGLYYVVESATEKSLWSYDLTTGKSRLVRHQVESVQPYMDQLIAWNGQSFEWLDRQGQAVTHPPVALQPLQVNSHWQVTGQWLYQTSADGAGYRLYRTDLKTGQSDVSEKYALGPYRSHFSVSPDQQHVLMTYFTEPETDIYRLQLNTP